MSNTYEQAKRNFQQATGLEDAFDLFDSRATNRLDYSAIFPGDNPLLWRYESRGDFYYSGRYAGLWLESPDSGSAMIDLDVLVDIVGNGFVSGHSPAGQLFQTWWDQRKNQVHIQWLGKPEEYLIADYNGLKYLLDTLSPVLAYEPDPTLSERHPLRSMVSTRFLDRGGVDTSWSPKARYRSSGTDEDPHFPGSYLAVNAHPLTTGRFHALHYEAYSYRQYGRFCGFYINAFGDHVLQETAYMYADAILRGRNENVQLHLTWPEYAVQGVTHTPSYVYLYNGRCYNDRLSEKHGVRMNKAKFEWLCGCLEALEALEERDPAEYYLEVR